LLHVQLLFIDHVPFTLKSFEYVHHVSLFWHQELSFSFLPPLLLYPKLLFVSFPFSLLLEFLLNAFYQAIAFSFQVVPQLFILFLSILLLVSSKIHQLFVFFLWWFCFWFPFTFVSIQYFSIFRQEFCHIYDEPFQAFISIALLFLKLLLR